MLKHFVEYTQNHKIWFCRCMWQNNTKWVENRRHKSIANCIWLNMYIYMDEQNVEYLTTINLILQVNRFPCLFPCFTLLVNIPVIVAISLNTLPS